MKLKIFLLLISIVIFSGCSLFKKNTVKVVSPPAIEVEAVPPSSAAKIPRNEEKETTSAGTSNESSPDATQKSCFIALEAVRKHCGIEGEMKTEVTYTVCTYEVKRPPSDKYARALPYTQVFYVSKAGWFDEEGWEPLTNAVDNIQNEPDFADAKSHKTPIGRQLHVHSGDRVYIFGSLDKADTGSLGTCDFNEAIAIAKEFVAQK